MESYPLNQPESPRYKVDSAHGFFHGHCHTQPKQVFSNDWTPKTGKMMDGKEKEGKCQESQQVYPSSLEAQGQC